MYGLTRVRLGTMLQQYYIISLSWKEAELEIRANRTIEVVSQWIRLARLPVGRENREAEPFTNRYNHTARVSYITRYGTSLIKCLGLSVGNKLLYKEYIKNYVPKAQRVMTSLVAGGGLCKI